MPPREEPPASRPFGLSAALCWSGCMGEKRETRLRLAAGALRSAECESSGSCAPEEDDGAGG
eukprot:1084921-Rhodomonas_salina.1